MRSIFTCCSVWLCLNLSLVVGADDAQYALKWKIATKVDEYDHVWDQACFSTDGKTILAVEKLVGKGAVVKGFVLKEFSLSGTALRESPLLQDRISNAHSSPRPGTISALLPLNDGALMLIGTIEHEGQTTIFKLDAQRNIVSAERLSDALYYAVFRKSRVLSDGVILVGSNGDEALALKVDLEGTVVWTRAYNRPERSNTFTDISLSEDGKTLFFVGQSALPNKFGMGPSDVWWMKANLEGEVVGETFFPGRRPGMIGELAEGRLAILYDNGTDLGANNRLRLVNTEGKMLSEFPIKTGSNMTPYRPSMARLSKDRFVISGAARLYEYDSTGREVRILGDKLVLPFHSSRVIIRDSSILVLGTTIDEGSPAHGNLYFVAP